MRVFINPGHALGGNPDPGCVNPAIHLRECDLAITYGSLCGRYLEAAGCEVKLLQSFLVRVAENLSRETEETSR